MKVKVYTDGGTYPNPGQGGAGIVIADEDGKVIIELSEKLGENVTCIQASYLAIIMGLKKAKDLGAKEVELYSDSPTVLHQLSGQINTQAPHLITIRDKVRSLLGEFRSYELIYIPAEYNARAQKLSSLALDNAPIIKKVRAIGENFKPGPL